MKKLKIILGVFIIMFIFSGCSLKELFVSEEEKTDRECDRIIQALENEDNEKLEKIFSEKALEEATNISQGYDFVSTTCKGDFLTKERIRFSSVSHYDKGKHSREIDAEYEIKTTEDEYFLYINYWPTNSIDSKNEGVYSLKLVTMEERNNTPDFDPGSINKIPGIYYPDDDE